MMNRPRPRKIINVIKSSPSSELELEKTFQQDEPVKQIETHPNSTINIESSNTVKTALIKPVSSTSNIRTASPEILNSIRKNASESLNTSNNFVPRKPIVATIKKANAPPPPTFSDSPKSSPISLTKTTQAKQIDSLNSSESKLSTRANTTESVTFVNSPPPAYNERTPTLSPKSSGEAFLDAADKAADFISGALLVTSNIYFK